MFIALLACAVAIAIAAEWPRVAALTGAERRQARERERRKKNLRVVRTDTDDFAASVQRDLERLPTTHERERRRR